MILNGTMKIKCLLVDDEPLAIALLQEHLSQLELFDVVATSNTAIKALEILGRQQIDLLFLDIQMPNITGIELLKTLRNAPKTILTTAYRDYALDSYELDIVDYLLKPITFDRFFKAIEKYLRLTSQNSTGINTITDDPYIMVKSASKFVKIMLSNIIYIESLKDYVNIHTLGGTVVSRHKISDLATKLSGTGFLRIHRSFIINIKNMTAFTANDIEIGGIELPLGDSYKEYVLKLLSGL